MSVTGPPAGQVAKRVAWAALATFLLAFLVLEVINHGFPALAAAVLFLIVPDLPVLIGASTAAHGKLAPKAVPYYNLAHRPWIPLAVLLTYSVGVLGDWVPLFTAALGWLTHIALDRTFAYGLRSPDGSRRLQAG
ncbi:DUF4260 family protein [Kribbella sp. NPDC051718]|uniref:DUF4260 family protein n=1 Tax=Kribbella sp. NPDC051718 TaxID=3155168 RepID=UPI00343E4E12